MLIKAEASEMNHKRPNAQDRRDFQAFQRHARRWLQRFGLTDYRVNFRLEPKDDSRMATIRMNSDTRVAEITLRFGGERDSSLERLALHEVIHLMLADLTAVAATRANDMHADCIREEHRLIERVIPVILGVRE
jgi:hypothetical protein